MNNVTVYQKPTCTTCRKLMHLLYDKGIHYDAIDYYVYPFSREKLKALIKKMGIPAHDLLRKTDRMYKELDLGNKKYSNDELIELMVMHPDLVQRPIVEIGNHAILARPPEKVLELFKK